MGPCDAVWAYLANDPVVTGNPGPVGQAADRTTYATNPLWQIVDGPYHMTAFSDTAHEWALAPNNSYSGPVKSGVAAITFHYYSSLTSEETALESGALDTGPVQPSDVTAGHIANGNIVAGHNKLASLSGFNVRTGAFWGFDYAYFNFNHSAGGSGNMLVNSLAVRQALEFGINQNAIVSSPSIYNGYAVPDCSPLPYLQDSYAKKPKCPYLYNEAKGKAALKKAGWTGSSAPLTCTKTGGCQGVPKGTKLSFTYYYPSGSIVQDTQLNLEKQAWAREGMAVTLDSTKDASAIAAFCLAVSSGPNGHWSVCQYGGWVYSPGAYPSGEQFLLAGAGSNAGEVNDPGLNHAIIKSISTTASLSAYNSYAASFLPLLYQPSSLGVGEARKTLLGIQPPNPLSDFNPEYIHCSGPCHP
jgi:peptide/nickel transport system substrate-binding protein